MSTRADDTVPAGEEGQVRISHTATGGPNSLGMRRGGEWEFLETAAGVSAGVGLDPRGEAWVRSSMTRGASGGVGKAEEGVAPKKTH